MMKAMYADVKFFPLIAMTLIIDADKQSPKTMPSHACLNYVYLNFYNNTITVVDMLLYMIEAMV